MSNLMKMKRLVDGDDHFAWRVEAACWVAGVDYSLNVLRFVSAQSDVLEQVTVDEFATVDSTGVDDETIQLAVEAYRNQPAK